MQQSIAKYLRPAVQWLCRPRNIQQATAGSKPIVKIAEDKFQVTIDVRQYSYEELVVKAGPDYIVVEGKQQRRVPNGCLARQFVRKFRLPEGCDPVKMESRLSDDGYLTVTAYRMVSEPKCNPCDKCINIVRTQNLSDGCVCNNTCSNYPSYNPYEMYLPICKETKTYKSRQPQPPMAPSGNMLPSGSVPPSYNMPSSGYMPPSGNTPPQNAPQPPQVKKQ